MPGSDGQTTSAARVRRGPRVIIGAPVYAHAAECAGAIESLLAQSERDFALVLVDDCSPDETPEIAQRLAARDPRVTFVRNPRRLGMIGNWKRAFDLARERYPDAEYFAWASDHDLWHPRWLESLVAALDASPAAVLAYPLNRRIGPDGELTDKRPWQFETRGIRNLHDRFRLTMRWMSAGNMVYGLARADAIEACGVYRHVLVPDRLLLMELALRGEFHQVPEVLWSRRWYGNIFSLQRQRRAFFPDGRPLYAYVPWWISHAVAVGWLYGWRGIGRPRIGRRQGLALSVRYLWLAWRLHARQELKQLRIDILQRAAFLRPAYQRWREFSRRLEKRRRGKKKRHKLEPSRKGAPRDLTLPR